MLTEKEFDKAWKFCLKSSKDSGGIAYHGVFSPDGPDGLQKRIIGTGHFIVAFPAGLQVSIREGLYRDGQFDQDGKMPNVEGVIPTKAQATGEFSPLRADDRIIVLAESGGYPDAVVLQNCTEQTAINRKYFDLISSVCRFGERCRAVDRRSPMVWRDDEYGFGALCMPIRYGAKITVGSHDNAKEFC